MKIKKVIFIFVYLLIIVFLMEFFSFSALMSLSIFRNKHSFRTALNKNLDELRAAWKEKIFYGDFDPLTQVRLVPYEKYSRLEINKHGFIGNGHHDPFLNSFPEKPKGLTRIMLLGGSSAAGAGYAVNKSTISALLEKMLNRHFAKSGQRYQVLNFAAAGGYTGAEVQKILSQLVYFEPDMIICMDGFNDAWNALFEHQRIGLEHGIINWSDFSYNYFELLNGYGRREEYPIKIFTFTTSLIIKVKKYLKVKKDVRWFYEKYPFYKQTEFVMREYPLLENVTYNNLDILAAYISQNPQIKLFSYLQPHALNGKKHLTENEKNNIDGWLKKYEGVGENFKKENYTKLMNAAFAKFEQVYSDLEKKYSSYPNIHFYSLTGIFSKIKYDVYLDTVHLIHEGNVIFARKFFNDILKLRENKRRR